jgi:hypothetical protein
MKKLNGDVPDGAPYRHRIIHGAQREEDKKTLTNIPSIININFFVNSLL